MSICRSGDTDCTVDCGWCKGGLRAPNPPLDELASLFAPLGPWVTEAACRDAADPSIFDAPEKADKLAHSNDELAARQRLAVSTCVACPVRQECRQDAEDNALTGIRGGVLYAGEPTAGRGIKQHDLTALYLAGQLDRPVGYQGRPRNVTDAPSAA